MSKHEGHFLLGFVLGATTAFSAALLLAPKTGEETQAKLRDLKDKITSRGKVYYDYANDAAADVKDSSSEKLGQLLDKTSDTLSDLDLDQKAAQAKDSFDNVTSNLRNHFDAANTQLNKGKTDKENYDDIVIDATDNNDAAANETVQSAFQEAKEAGEETPSAPTAPSADKPE
ncbi:hypothetical protein FC83_GL000300 [Agrilactobacillus composti DSM 18527 = JCM 14202]|uniref:General stress protein n=1 Tax=Agrilactobacillus composti DSM 18527 = JCM 14202 TaxID=1423734 RepID=X0PEH0_9LACO|nr:YtxH domain-containing protein [Agrilactobacillus composti]KRM32436.1 hypothetical protein FC83_GL000300 [Agrilactobacillus composti DSM 18527 = JCM 14202]GAF39858.1 general stress protein [Agrilactobacillus composti DSM 18527 = JCM 14202]